MLLIPNNLQIYIKYLKQGCNQNPYPIVVTPLPRGVPRRVWTPSEKIWENFSWVRPCPSPTLNKSLLPSFLKFSFLIHFHTIMQFKLNLIQTLRLLSLKKFREGGTKTTNLLPKNHKNKTKKNLCYLLYLNQE